MSHSLNFPDGFLWGSATAAYQIEGAVNEGGRGSSIWDTFSRTPGKVRNGDTGDIADDHYHRWPQDVQTIKDLGLQAYRFSIAWPRVQPGGRGEYNAEGIDFYSRLVDALIAAGVRPVATLYHWDLPQELQDAGGWANRDTAYLFTDYARKMAQALGDRVEVWTTFNEPWCTAYLGYGSGNHAPGIVDGPSALKAVHHLNLAHGLAGRAVREELGPDTQLSVTLNLHVVRPYDPDSEADIAAARKIDVLGNEVFLGPMLEGAYPEELFAQTAAVTDWSFVQDADLKIANVPLSILGVNYYSSADAKRVPPGTAKGHAAHGGGEFSPWVGADDVEFPLMPGPHTAMGWNIDPEAFTELLLQTSKRFPQVPLMVTENGAAFDDDVSPDGRVHDDLRVDYLRRHIGAVLDSIQAGADVRGYFVWSLLDNFEWSYGYDKRFGIIRVDYDTLERIWKDSAYWYAGVIRTNSVPA